MTIPHGENAIKRCEGGSMAAQMCSGPDAHTVRELLHSRAAANFFLSPPHLILHVKGPGGITKECAAKDSASFETPGTLVACFLAEKRAGKRRALKIDKPVLCFPIISPISTEQQGPGS